MKTKISQDQYATDFKQVVLYNSVYAIHTYFDNDPQKFIDVLKRYSEVKKNYADERLRIDPLEFHNLIQQIERINYAFSLPREFVAAMFHSRNGKQNYAEAVDLLVSTKQIHRWKHGVLSTKTAVKRFAAKYLYQFSALIDIFADKDRLAKALNFTSDFYTKRQYRFISKLKNLKQQKEQTMPHNENEPTFINPMKTFSKRKRMTKSQIQAANVDIPEPDVEDMDTTGGFTCFSEKERDEFMKPLKYEVPIATFNSEDHEEVSPEQQRKIDAALYAFRRDREIDRKVIYGKITAKEADELIQNEKKRLIQALKEDPASVQCY